MKALTDAGIDEASVQIGDTINWAGKDFHMAADAVSFIERDDAGTITRLGFACWKGLFTNRMKLSVSLDDGPSMYTNPMEAVGHWYRMALADGRVRA